MTRYWQPLMFWEQLVCWAMYRQGWGATDIAKSIGRLPTEVRDILAGKSDAVLAERIRQELNQMYLRPSEARAIMAEAAHAIDLQSQIINKLKMQIATTPPASPKSV